MSPLYASDYQDGKQDASMISSTTRKTRKTMSKAACIKCGAIICAALARLGSTTCHDHRPAKRR